MTQDMARHERMTRYRRLAKRILTPVVLLIAVIYFVIDALVLSLVKPLAARLSVLPVFVRLVRWLRTLGPYPTLALFLIPVLLLEPIKPLAAYLIASRHAAVGVTLLVVGELLKVAVLERLYHVSRDKLLSIRAFAWCHGIATRWLDYLRALPPWRAVARQVQNVKTLARKFVAFARG